MFAVVGALVSEVPSRVVETAVADVPGGGGGGGGGGCGVAVRGARRARRGSVAMIDQVEFKEWTGSPVVWRIKAS